VDSLEPRYYSNNGRQHLPLLREAECSGKGHGMFVFCSNKAIAVSWDGISWLFAKLTCLKAGECCLHAHHVEVITDDGILVVVDDNIIFIKLTFKVNPPNIANGINLSEPQLEVKPMRILKMDFFPYYRRITQAELDFENGQPFLFIIAERIYQKIRGGESVGECKNALDFVMKRIDFLNDNDEDIHSSIY